MELLVAMQRRDVVACRILLGCAHVTLGIDGVVETPVGDRGHGYTATEHIGTFTHGHEGVETAETPSPDGDTVLIDIGLLTHVKGYLYLVL